METEVAAPAMMPGKVDHAEACWHKAGRTSMSNFKKCQSQKDFCVPIAN